VSDVWVGKRYKADFTRVTTMEKVKRFKRIIIVAGVLLIIVLIFAGIHWQSTPRMLYPEEIREYEGQDLSSIGDFRENSIKGP